VVEDLGSRNGTGVNGEEIDGPQPLAEGDLL
jgi:pSer/pThr/pTyr-binding forkhead associated (FHA) protein